MEAVELAQQFRSVMNDPQAIVRLADESIARTMNPEVIELCRLCKQAALDLRESIIAITYPAIVRKEGPPRDIAKSIAAWMN